jgi:hypothetical protein
MTKGMMGLRRRTVIEWFKCQSKFSVMWDFRSERFQIRDIVNKIAIGEFMEWDDAAEWVFDLAHGQLHNEEAPNEV